MDRQPLTDRLGDRLLAEYGGAAAAYSLRALNGNGDNVVRVRRASDNDEKDFTAEQIELGEMVNWVNSQTVPPLDIGVETSEGRIPVPEGGTSIGTPAAAYSLRNLSTTYTGNVVDVRRSSDDAEASFTAAEVSDGTLEDWVNADVISSGYVSKWYDQSGNNNHAVQTTPANQPTIVEGGSLVTNEAGKVSVKTEKGNFMLLDSTITLSSAFSLFGVIDADNDTSYPDSGNNPLLGRYNTNTQFLGIGNDDEVSPNTFSIRFNGQSPLTVNEGDIGFGLTSARTYIYNGSTVSGFDDGSNTFEITASGVFTSNMIFARSFAVEDFETFKGTVAELIIYDSDQSDNRTAIEANIGETYGISGIPAYDNTVDGFVETWYDQSGNGNDATQSVAGNQPKIVDGGSLVADGINFEPNVNLPLSGDGLDIFRDVAYGQIFSVIKPRETGTAVKRYFEAEVGVGSGARFLFGDGPDVAATFRIGGRSLDGDSFGDEESPTSHNNDLSLITGFLNYTDAEGFLFLNGAQVATNSIPGMTAGNTSDTSSQEVAIGSITPGLTTEFNAKEIIIYNSDQSATRTAIESNINAHYDIYP